MMHPAQTILRPVDPYGPIIQNDDQIEFLVHGKATLFDDQRNHISIPSTTIQIAQHTDGTWMWATQTHSTWSGRGYRIGPKWGKFAPTRQDAIAAACNEIEAQGPDQGVIDWLDSLCAPSQMELFA
jgi:hypothetical protein